MMSQSQIQSQNKELGAIDLVENAKCEKGDFKFEKLKKRQKRKRRTKKVDVDDASRLQKRTRYLLIRMKVEQNLLDAYSTEGWKGQSREKIKPERELQRAKKQILKCKLGIRDAIRQLDLLSSVGCIDDSAIAPDGSVHHDHIHCAKCKLREAFPDNDIILCDGTCNCAFHQMCIDPPLLTENIPPGDQGWFCKYCICKTEIIDAMNAHLGTSYRNDSHWQEIFKVEATLPDDGETFLDQQEWPSDDSEDDDYDPNGTEKHENNFGNIKVSSGGESNDDGASSSCSLWSLEDEVFDDEFGKSRKINMGLESTSVDFMRSDFDSDCENASGRRQRRAVDYRKLYDEMFGKDALANDEASEDEDWGPTKRKRKEKESDAATTLMTLCETEGKCVNDDTKLSCQESKRSFFRIPPEAVEKLRLVFVENELPSRAVKEELSKQLGLDSEKVNKWFKNARYLALKTRKSGEENSTQNEPEAGKNKAINEMLSEDTQTPNNIRVKKFRRRKNAHSPKEDLYISTSNNQIDNDVKIGDDFSLKMLRENAKNEKSIFSHDKQEEEKAEAEAKMERLSLLKEKLEKLQEVLRPRLPKRRAKNAVSSTIYVPFATVKEKT